MQLRVDMHTVAVASSPADACRSSIAHHAGDDYSHAFVVVGEGDQAIVGSLTLAFGRRGHESRPVGAGRLGPIRSTTMTINAILTYLGVALTFSAAIFLLLGIRRPREHSNSVIQGNREPRQDDLEVLATRHANIACGALLLALALATELISLAEGGPSYGERSGNVLGGVLATAMATFVCLIGCLVARQFILRRLRRKIRAQGGWSSE